MNFLVCDTSLIQLSHLITDEYISYEDGNFWNKSHAPISWHSYAAAMNGRFISTPHEKLKECVEWADTIMVGINYHPKASQKIIESMIKQGKIVIGFFHENGDAFQHNAKNLQWVKEFRDCANQADFFLTYPMNDVFRGIYENLGIQKEKLVYIPQPYDLSRAHEFMTPESERKGVFIGPRKKDDELEKRNWILNIIRAAGTINSRYYDIEPLISLINSSSIPNETLKKDLQDLYPYIIFDVYSPLPYEELLRLIGKHQFYINDDGSTTQGQIDADSLFVGIRPLDVSNQKFFTDFGKLYEDGIQWPEDFMKKHCSFEVCKDRIENLIQNYIN